jgi:hypothetical protein
VPLTKALSYGETLSFGGQTAVHSGFESLLVNVYVAAGVEAEQSSAQIYSPVASL